MPTIILLYLVLIRQLLSQSVLFQNSSVTLPFPLTNHISGAYSNTIHIIGGYLNGNTSTPSTNIYILPGDVSGSGSTDYSMIPSTTFLSSSGDDSIICMDSCSAIIDSKLYVFQYKQISSIYPFSTPWMLIWNMDTKTWENTANYPYDLQAVNGYGNSQKFLTNSNLCTFSSGTKVYVIAHSNYTDCSTNTSMGSELCIGQNEYPVLIYDTVNNLWSNYSLQLTAPRINFGCSRVAVSIYIIGGQYVSSGNEGNVIEKCDLNGRHYTCSVIASMDNSRSHLQLTNIARKYALIHGDGDNAEAQKEMEIFYGQKEYSDIISSPWNIGKLSVSAYSSFIDGDLFVVTGGNEIDTGIATNSISYMNATKLLTNPSNASFTWDSPCITRYNAEDQDVPLDDYLLNLGKLRYEVFEIGLDSSVYIYSNGGLGEFWFEVNEDNEVRYARKAGMEVDIDDIEISVNLAAVSRLSGLPVTDDTDSLPFWMEWDGQYWDAGFGTVVGVYGLENWMENYEPIELIDIYQILLQYGVFVFYHDECNLALDIDVFNDTFSVGDYIRIDFNLSQSTSLNSPIQITSSDLGIDYSMEIDEVGCLLCNNKDRVCTRNCTQGIKIDSLSTYDIENNEYQIFISSDLENIVYPNGNPYVIKRNVMEVEVLIEVETNSSRGLYPGKELFIRPIIDIFTLPTQPNGTIYIQFDDDLSFINGYAQIFIDFYDDFSCTIIYDNTSISCDEPIIIPSDMKYKSITNNNYSIELWSNDINLIDDTIHHFQRRIQTLLVEFGPSLYLGEAIYIDVLVMDDEIFQTDSIINVVNPIYGIASTITVTYTNAASSINDTKNSTIIDRCDIFTEFTQSQDLCSSGLSWSTSNASLLGSSITLQLSSDDTFLINSEQQILIEDCPPGQGLLGSDVTSYVCDDCPLDQVGINENSQCISCDGIPGIDCYGSNEMIIFYNYWVAINSPNNTYLFDIFNNADTMQSQSILATFCPAGFCCQDEMGCNYNNTGQTKEASSVLCGVNRDPYTPLCGACIDGYSEVFGTSGCKKCEKNNYGYLIIILMLTLIFVFLFIFLDGPGSRDNQNDTKEVDTTSYLIKDDLQGIQIMVLRPFAYFFQGISYITIQTGFLFYFTPLIQLFSLDMIYSTSNDDDSGICFIKGMKSLDEELWLLTIPICMFLSLGIFAAFNFLLRKLYKKQIARLQFGWNIFWSIFIILIGNIITKMLKILACSKITDDLFVHFHGGYEKCFGPIWWVALFIMFGVILLWIGVLIKLSKMTSDERNTRQSPFRTVTKPYKLEYWYYELILVSRRIILAVLVTFQYIDQDVTQFILLLVLIAYLILHVSMYPFKHLIVNRMETICLFLLIMGLATINSGFHTQSPEIVSLIMAMIVLIPCLFIAGGLILAFYNYKKDKEHFTSGDIEANSKINARIDGMKSRLTKTQKNLFKGNSGGRSNSSYQHANEDSDEMEKNMQTENALSAENLDGIELSTIEQHRSTQL